MTGLKPVNYHITSLFTGRGVEAETSKVNLRNFTMIEKNRSRCIFSGSHHDVIFPHEEITQRSIQAEIDTKVKDNN